MRDTLPGDGREDPVERLVLGESHPQASVGEHSRQREQACHSGGQNRRGCQCCPGLCMT